MTKYQKRIPHPLLDRIDIHIEVPRVNYEKLSSDRVGETSASLMKSAMSQLQLSAQAYRTRTIADLAGIKNIQMQHLAQALQYRPKL